MCERSLLSGDEPTKGRAEAQRRCQTEDSFAFFTRSAETQPTPPPSLPLHPSTKRVFVPACKRSFDQTPTWPGVTARAIHIRAIVQLSLPFNKKIAEQNMARLYMAFIHRDTEKCTTCILLLVYCIPHRKSDPEVPPSWFRTERGLSSPPR